MKRSKTALAVAATFAVALCVAAPAFADSAFLDPDGLNWWEQLLDWLSGGDDSAFLDPDG